MKDLASNYRDLCVETIVSAIACVLVGVIAYGYGVFSVYNHKFVFVADGLTGAFAFYSLRRLRGRDVLLFLSIAFLLQVTLLTKTIGTLRIVMEFVFFVPVPLASAVLFWSYRKHLNEVKIYDPLILGAFCAALISVARAIYYAAVPIMSGVPGWPPTVPFSLAETVESFLIGFGIGFGLWILDLQEVKRYLHLTKGFSIRAA